MTIRSAHPPEAFIERLRTHTLPKQPWFRFADKRHLFIGEVQSTGFLLAPVIRGRNTYLPKLHGRIVPRGSGVEIELVQTLHPLGIAAVLGFFFFPLGLCLRDHSYFGVVVGVLILTVFHTILYFVGFVPDAQRSEAHLRDIAS